METKDPNRADVQINASEQDADASDLKRSKPELVAELRSLRETIARIGQDPNGSRALFDGVPDGVIVHDVTGAILDVNRATSERLGYSVEDLRTMHLRDILSPEFAMQIGSRLADALGGQTVTFETTYLASSGKRIPCEVVERAVVHNGQKALQSVARDISHRTWRPEDLAESEQRYKTIFEDSLEAMSLIHEGKIMDVNRAWLKLHGFSSKSEVVGTDVMGLVHEDDRRILAKRRRASAPEVKRLYQVRDTKKDGTVIDVELYSSSITVDGKDAIITTVRDITERKRIEREREQLVRLLSEYNLSLEKVNAELERSNKELEDFAHVVSHDLQEPLRMVTSYLKLLSERYRGKLDAEADQFIEYATTGAGGMHRLITDLLDYARVDTSPKQFERVDLEAVLERVLANLQPAVQESGAVIRHDALPTILADDLQFGQLLQNLIGNAVKFRGEAAPRIHVAAKKKDNVWLFSVKDNGIGIDPEYAQRIFTIFQRLHSKSKYPGSGIGLSICKKIVERHGGRIWVESELGHGATFYFTIPVREEPSAKEKAAPAGKIHILMAEDNEGDARLVQEAIKDLKLAATVAWVEDGAEAIEYLYRRGEYAEATRPDLILLDLNMPKKNGHEVLAEIKASEELKAIPVAVITTSRDKQDILKSGNLHATWYVTKPVDVYQLMTLAASVREPQAAGKDR